MHQEPVRSASINKTGPYRVSPNIWKYVKDRAPFYSEITVDSNLRQICLHEGMEQAFICFERIDDYPD